MEPFLIRMLVFMLPMFVDAGMSRSAREFDVSISPKIPIP